MKRKSDPPSSLDAIIVGKPPSDEDNDGGRADSPKSPKTVDDFQPLDQSKPLFSRLLPHAIEVAILEWIELMDWATFCAVSRASRLGIDKYMRHDCSNLAFFTTKSLLPSFLHLTSLTRCLRTLTLIEQHPLAHTEKLEAKDSAPYHRLLLGSNAQSLRHLTIRASALYCVEMPLSATATGWIVFPNLESLILVDESESESQDSSCLEIVLSPFLNLHPHLQRFECTMYNDPLWLRCKGFATLPVQTLVLGIESIDVLVAVLEAFHSTLTNLTVYMDSWNLNRRKGAGAMFDPIAPLKETPSLVPKQLTSLCVIDFSHDNHDLFLLKEKSSSSSIACWHVPPSLTTLNFKTGYSAKCRPISSSLRALSLGIVTVSGLETVFLDCPNLVDFSYSGIARPPLLALPPPTLTGDEREEGRFFADFRRWQQQALGQGRASSPPSTDELVAGSSSSSTSSTSSLSKEAKEEEEEFRVKAGQLVTRYAGYDCDPGFFLIRRCLLKTPPTCLAALEILDITLKVREWSHVGRPSVMIYFTHVAKHWAHSLTTLKLFVERDHELSIYPIRESTLVCPVVFKRLCTFEVTSLLLDASIQKHLHLNVNQLMEYQFPALRSFRTPVLSTRHRSSAHVFLASLKRLNRLVIDDVTIDDSKEDKEPTPSSSSSPTSSRSLVKVSPSDLGHLGDLIECRGLETLVLQEWRVHWAGLGTREGSLWPGYLESWPLLLLACPNVKNLSMEVVSVMKPLHSEVIRFINGSKIEALRIWSNTPPEFDSDDDHKDHHHPQHDDTKAEVDGHHAEMKQRYKKLVKATMNLVWEQCPRLRFLRVDGHDEVLSTCQRGINATRQMPEFY